MLLVKFGQRGPLWRCRPRWVPPWSLAQCSEPVGTPKSRLDNCAASLQQNWQVLPHLETYGTLSAMARWLGPILGAVLLLCARAHSAAALTQPTGTEIPTDTDVQEALDALGETVDPLNDAAVTPETFRPECSLTFTLLRRWTDYRNSFGWYNVTGEVPDLSELYEFIHCDDLPDPWQNGDQTTRVLDIKNDARYLGGEIGFFQARAVEPSNGCADVTQPDTVEFVVYSQPELNPEDTDEPFIHLLIMDSKIDSNVFYFAWEDLLSGGDNDFSDLVIRVEGITCSGGGEPCDTGELGVCGPGLTQCENGEIVCKPRIAPSDEECNGLDDDCDGTVDDGDLCAENEICDRGVCIAACGGGEFRCFGNLICRGDGYCVDPKCEDVECAEGEICRDGNCVDPCAGVVCPYQQECRAGRCVDPCAGMDCGENQACVQGACLTTCECSGCPQGEYCNLQAKQCLESACDSVSCDVATHCEAGSCVDDCQDAVCPGGAACVQGQCESDEETGSGGSSASADDPDIIVDGGLLPSSGSSATATGAGGTAATGSSSGTTTLGGTTRRDGSNDAGCGCRFASTPTPRHASWLWLWFALAPLRRLRRAASW